MTVAVGLQHQHCDNFDEIQQEKAKQNGAAIYIYIYVYIYIHTRVGTLIVATIYLQLIQNRYMFRRFNVLQCSHQHCVQPVASDVEVLGYL